MELDLIGISKKLLDTPFVVIGIVNKIKMLKNIFLAKLVVCTYNYSKIKSYLTGDTMKKILTIIAASLALTSGLLLSSCSDDDDDLLGPKNVWCEMPVKYSNGKEGNEAKSAIIYVSMYYSDTNVSGSDSGSRDLKKGTTIPAGITMVVTAKPNESGTLASEVISGLTENTYIMKTFPLNENAEFEKDDSGPSDSKLNFKANRGWWTALYLLKSDLRKNQDVNPPAVLSNASSAKSLEWENDPVIKFV